MLIEQFKRVGQRILNYRRPYGPTLLDFFDEGIHDSNYWSLHYQLKMAQKYGDLFYMPAEGKYIVVGARATEYILKTNHTNYVRSTGFYKRNMEPFFGNSLIVNEGAFWRQRRRIAQPFFLKASVPKHLPKIIAYTSDFLKELQWEKQGSQKIDMLAFSNLLTFTITNKLIYNLSLPLKQSKKLEQEIQFCNKYCANSLLLPFKKIPSPGNVKFYRCIRKLDRLLLDLIQERRKNPDLADDLLSIMLNANIEGETIELSNDEILAELKTHLITGFETSACAITWMFYSLTKHPKYYTAMLEEIDSVLQGREPTLDDLSHLVLTKAILDETLRLYPPAWTFIRDCLEEDVILGIPIPKGTKIRLNLYALHRNPDYWDDPNTFKPERFLHGKPSHPYAYLPFGGGPHMCIGSHLAIPEILTLVVLLCQRFQFRLLRHSTPKMDLNVSLKPVGGIKMQAMNRL